MLNALLTTVPSQVTFTLGIKAIVMLVGAAVYALANGKISSLGLGAFVAGLAAILIGIH